MNGPGPLAIVTVTLGTVCFGAVATPWEEYVAQPSAERASRVQVRSYSVERRDPERDEWDLMLLEVQVLSRDLEAVRLAFRLRAGADGHAAEMLDIMLGRLIRIDAAMFLRELKSAGVVASHLESLVGNFGPEYVDRADAYAYEAAQRVAALRKVSDGDLKALRDQCVALLGR